MTFSHFWCIKENLIKFVWIYRLFNVSKVQNVSAKYAYFRRLHFITEFTYFGINDKFSRKSEVAVKFLTFGDPQNCCWCRSEHCETAF